MIAPKLNGYQVRTERTKAQLLVAAEQVFSREGFEAAQMETIAKAAGRSKGAIYAHYKSKDDLFLALFEHRTITETRKVLDKVLQCRNRADAVEALKADLIELTKDRTWILLTIEAKLYALRHPEMRERWLAANKTLRFRGGVFDDERQKAAKLIFGKVSAARRAELEARALAFGPIISGLVLEAEFEPELLTKKCVGAILKQIADTLLQT